MWKFLQAFCRARNRSRTQQKRSDPGISRIGAVELASLFVRAGDNLMIFDLRESAEIEAYPCAIQGALLTFNVNLHALIPWIPPETVVILYATSDIPAHYAFVHLLSRKLRIYALDGGLRSWREAGLPLEHVVFGDRRLSDNR